MATFPRVEKPTDITRPKGPRGIMARSQRGRIYRRSTNARGWVWTEEWNRLLQAGAADAEALLSFIDHHASREKEFDIEHLILPGSGLAPNGDGASGVTVNGANQTGTSISLTGFSGSTPAVAAGDFFRIAGINHAFKATADSGGGSSVSVDIMPSILEGQSPADGAAVTLTGMKFRAAILDWSAPKAPPNTFYTGLSVTFVELV